jgi:tetratricopeptide (TPR) repeat protein
LLAVPLVIAWLTYAFFWAEDRFRFHALGVLAMSAGICLDFLLQRMRAGAAKPAAAAFVAALALFSASLALSAGTTLPPPHWDQIVWGYIKMGRLHQAQAVAERVAGEQPDNAPIFEAQGYLAVLRQDYAEAARCYGRAVELRPRSDQAHFNLARSYLALDRRDAALQEAQIALELKEDPDYRALVQKLKSAP